MYYSMCVLYMLYSTVCDCCFSVAMQVKVRCVLASMLEDVRTVLAWKDVRGAMRR